MSTKNEVATMPKEITEVINTAGVELSKAQKIASGYAPYMIQAQEIAEKLKGLDPTNPEHVAIARRGRIDLGTICSAVGKTKDSDKALIKIEDKLIMSFHNVVVGFSRLTQEDAKSIEEHEQRLEAERKEALKAERMRQLEAFEIFTNDANVENMSEDVWKNYSNGVRLNYEAVKEAEAKSEAERIEREQKETLFNSRKMELLPLSDHTDIAALTIDTTEDEFKTMVETAKSAKQSAIEEQKKREAEAEKIRLKAEADAKAAREARAKADAELAKVQAEAKAKHRALEEQARKDREAADKLRKEAEAKKAAEDAAEDAKLKAEQAPDKDKIKAALKDMNMPAIYFKSKEVAETYSDIESKFLAFKSWADKQVEAIK